MSEIVVGLIIAGIGIVVTISTILILMLVINALTKIFPFKEIPKEK